MLQSLHFLCFLLYTLQCLSAIFCPNTTEGILDIILTDKEPFPLVDTKDHLRSLMITLEGNNKKCLKKTSRKEFKRHDGRHIYLDLGSGDLNNTFKFIQTYPNASKYEIYCFDPDVNYGRLYSELQKSHETINFINKAVGVKDGPLYWTNTSSGLVMLTEEAGGEDKASSTIPVPTIGLAKFLLSSTGANVGFGDKLVVRMDISGMEFPLLHQLARTAALGLVSELLLECHYGDKKSASVFWTDCLHLVRSMKKVFKGSMEVVMWNSLPMAIRTNPHYIPSHGGVFSPAGI